ncbi:hypothetical protein PGTUg99_036623 [Puccinia graminis f. sp. tritici]|uniref:Guanylate kinase n=1 Tax=Puccinia graminis f. sp. tritici TaxID=56615 RepID=A0A5B0RAA7_PUCGR|nr:hypothetical protein PGTUg99_036623 [Puccinia graminis f. sp. tritici]
MYKHSLHQLIQPIHQRLPKPSISSFINTPTKHPIRTTSTSMAPSASAQLQPIVVFGPSGSGKSTLIKRLQASQDWPNFGFSVSHTTRKPREGEADGVAYHFVSRESFQEMVTKGEFIEHAEFGGNCYGTSLKAVSEVSEHQKKRCILDIDAQGVKLILKNHPSLSPLIIFVCPPSIEELRSRLEARGTESEESLKSRLGMAQSEIDYAKSGPSDLIIVNQNLDEAYRKFHLACTVNKNENPSQFPQSDPIPF